MAFKPTNPEEGTITKQMTVSLVEYNIHKLEYIIDPNKRQNTKIKIKWSNGYYDRQGVYIPLKMKEMTFAGQEVLVYLGSDFEGENLYMRTQNAAWKFLQDKGFIPKEGSVE